jgi:hypothetical protein
MGERLNDGLTADKAEFHKRVYQNDSYPPHSHTFVVCLYTRWLGKEVVHRFLGPFNSREVAWDWGKAYIKRYTEPCFIVRMEVMPMCEVL